MSVLRPFCGLRPPRDQVLAVACPPYDVVNTQEARAYAGDNRLSFFHISKPEIEFADDHDPYAAEVYARGGDNLRRFLAQGTLRPDPTPCLYIYRQRMGDHLQTGLVAGASVDEYQQGLIKKHELTRADKEDDRTRHVDVLGGNDEPVFLTYRARPEIDALIAAITTTPAEYDFVTDDGIGHTFWVVSQRQAIAALERELAAVPHLYVADGHHRSAAASRVRELWRERAGAGHHGDEEYNYFLAVVFPHDQMKILDYNRVVRDLGGRSPEAFLELVGEKFAVTALAGMAEARPDAVHRFGLYLGGRWYRLQAREGSYDARDPIDVLDVSILQRNLLAPLLGIADPRTDKRINFVGGIRGLGELERLVDGGQYRVAFALHPTTIEQVMAIADAGQIMPPKSTWFEPKLRSGLVLHPFEVA
jgi:uncharacterized protein (DUF1015 family)